MTGGMAPLDFSENLYHSGKHSFERHVFESFPAYNMPRLVIWHVFEEFSPGNMPVYSDTSIKPGMQNGDFPL